MSTADSQLLVAGAAIHHDLQRAKGVAPDVTKGSAKGAARLAVFAVALAAVLLAWLLPESIFSRVLFAWNALGAAFGPVVVARLLGWRLKSWSVPTAICTGFLLTVVFYSLPDGPGDLWERGVPFLVATVTLFLGRASSR